MCRHGAEFPSAAEPSTPDPTARTALPFGALESGPPSARDLSRNTRDEHGELSEHALGNAIDIAGFRLGDGSIVTVREGWGSPEWGPTLRRLHRAGCGPFGTALGPEANPLHADHLHFDVETRRSGPYCR